jgi:hypothetical protein
MIKNIKLFIKKVKIKKSLLQSVSHHIKLLQFKQIKWKYLLFNKTIKAKKILKNQDRNLVFRDQSVKRNKKSNKTIA